MPDSFTSAERSHNLNRRELLRVLAASGCALGAAGFLPGKWTKPLVQSGVLPAHAQSTQPLVCNFTLDVVSYDFLEMGNFVLHIMWAPAVAPTGFDLFVGGVAAVVDGHEFGDGSGVIYFHVGLGTVFPDGELVLFWPDNCSTTDTFVLGCVAPACE